MSEKDSIRQFKTTAYGKYFLLERLAVGGMAEVFKAKTFGVRGFERLLVIKRILPHLSKDEDFVEMFIDEAKISVELSHANVVQVTDLGKIGDNYFIAMEYIDGKDLRAILKKGLTSNQRLSVEQATYVAIEACKGLDYAHRKKSSSTNKPLDIIHRDISPQNIMISYEGEVKIVDFGIAKTASKLNQTQAGVLKGKFGYMSPEQAMGLEVDQRTDIFSTGIILFEILTGRRLFLGDTDFETLEKIKQATIPLPSTYNPKVPKELERIILKALAKDLNERYSSAREMLVDLTKFFYSIAPDFHASDFSSYLKKLFKDDIKEERMRLKQALATLPIEGLIDSELASHSDEQIIESQSDGQTIRSISQAKAQQQKDIAKIDLEAMESFKKAGVEGLKPSILERTFGRIFKRSENEGGMKGWFSSNKYMVFGILLLVMIAAVTIAVKRPGVEPAIKDGTPTPGPSSGAFNLISTPSEAKVYVNGEYSGETPVKLDIPYRETLNIEIKKQGHRPFYTRLFLTEKDNSEQRFVLEPVIEEKSLLKVTSTPPGASILINGKGTGQTTPAIIENLNPGEEYSVSLKLAGYSDIEKSIRLEPGPKNEIEIKLSSSGPMFIINTVPTGAKVSIEGFKEKKSPAVFTGLSKGRSYDITIYKGGFEPLKKTVAASGGPQSIRYVLERAKIEYGYLSVNAIPYAQIWIDGVLKGYTPQPKLKVEAGQRVIRFSHPSAPNITKTVNVQPDKTEKLIVEMKIRE